MWTPSASLGAEFEHLGTEGGDDARVGVLGLVGVHRRLVHGREVLTHVGQRRTVLVSAQAFDQGLVADAESQHEAIVEGGVRASARR